MSQPIAPWRVTYAPGTWVALAGPSALAVLQPAPARVSGLLGRFWDDLLTATSIQDVSANLAKHNLTQLAGFALFFWDDAGVHAVTRGGVRVEHAASGELLDTSEGSETILGRNAAVRVIVEPAPSEQLLTLPLVAGGATISSLVLTTSPESVVRSSQLGAMAAAFGDGAEPGSADLPVELDSAGVVPEADPVEPDLEQGGDQGAAGHTDDALEAEAVEVVAASLAGETLEPEPQPEPMALAQPQADEQEPLAAEVVEEHSGNTLIDPAISAVSPGDPASPEPVPEPEIRGEYHPESALSNPPSGLGAAGAAALASPMIPPPNPDVAAPAGLVNGGASPVPPPPAAPAASQPMASAADSDQGGLVSAVVCPQGHVNPPGSQNCRVCNGPVGGITRLVPRPKLAVVRSSFGVSVELTSPIVIGRAPNTSGDPSAQVLKVPSPNTDISRSHLRVRARDWQVEVEDLNSTNGTTLAAPGEQPFRLAPGVPTVAPIGSIVDLGDGIQVRIDPGE